jgi:hypothetical protein
MWGSSLGVSISMCTIHSYNTMKWNLIIHYKLSLPLVFIQAHMTNVMKA